MAAVVGRGALAAGPIHFDGSLGNTGDLSRTKGDLSGNTVFANRGKLVGANLFHSFSRFNVESGKTITFEAPAATHNILARVTGTDPSHINGTIATAGEPVGGKTPKTNANLYLMNPNGVIFGEGASVNVAGSFTATTADYIAFADQDGVQARFWASESGNTTLVSAPPSKFGFLDNGASGEIRFEDVETGEEENFAAGDFAVVARSVTGRNTTLTANAGNVIIRAVGAGDHPIKPAQIATPVPLGNLSQITFTRFGVESLNHDIVIESMGDISFNSGFFNLTNRVASGETQAKIQIITGGSMTIHDTALNLTNSDTASGGEIQLQAGGNIFIKGMTSIKSVLDNNLKESVGAPINIRGGGGLKIEDSGSIWSENHGGGNGGQINIFAGDGLEIEGSGFIRSENYAGGNGGLIGILGGDGLEIGDSGSIESKNYAGGNGGRIRINLQGEALLRDFGLIQSGTKGRGRGGLIDLCAAALRVDGVSEIGRNTGIESVTESEGAGGDIGINVEGQILLKNTGGIFASTNTKGRSGSIKLNSGSLRIIGARNLTKDDVQNLSKEEVAEKFPNIFITGISIKSAFDVVTGNLGSIVVNVAGAITLKRGGHIDATSFSKSSAAKAGNVTVTAGSIRADRGGSDYFTGIGAGTVTDKTTGNSDSAKGGKITVTASSIELLNGAQIAASSRSRGDAGKIKVFTNDLFADGCGPITDFLFTGESGVVASTQGSSSGSGGSVFIGELPGAVRSRIILSNYAEIGARVDGPGQGGSIRIDYQNGRISLDSESKITARSGKSGGNAGSIKIRGKVIEVTDGALISSEAISPEGGEAGSVTLSPGRLLMDEGRLKVSSKGANAGSIRILGGDLLDFREGRVIADAARNGGNVFIQGARQLLLDHTRVDADAISEGKGGNIDLNARVILENASTITAKSRNGKDGLVRIDPQAVLSGAEEQKDPQPLDVTDSLQPDCTTRLVTQVGSFIRAGRGGSPRLPGGYLPSIRLHQVP
ncbi:MAG: filamentous hemagglutinin N-terminal domain-containing protein [Luteolibacter sp.]